MADLHTKHHVTASDAICKQIWLLCVFYLNLVSCGHMALFISCDICLYYVGVKDLII